MTSENEPPEVLLVDPHRRFAIGAFSALGLVMFLAPIVQLPSNKDVLSLGTSLLSLVGLGFLRRWHTLNPHRIHLHGQGISFRRGGVTVDVGFAQLRVVHERRYVDFVWRGEVRTDWGIAIEGHPPLWLHQNVFNKAAIDRLLQFIPRREAAPAPASLELLEKRLVRSAWQYGGGIALSVLLAAASGLVLHERSISAGPVIVGGIAIIVAWLFLGVLRRLIPVSRSPLMFALQRGTGVVWVYMAESGDHSVHVMFDDGNTMEISSTADEAESIIALIRRCIPDVLVGYGQAEEAAAWARVRSRDRRGA